MKNKLFIGITTSKRNVHTNFSTKDITYINDSFLNLLKSYDHVIPIILDTNSNPDHAEEIVKKLDGIIFSSGEDIHPNFYNAENTVHYDKTIKDAGKLFKRPFSFSPNRQRDLFEISLYHAAKAKNLSILGICRGMQLINIAEGGTLHQELPTTHVPHFSTDNILNNYHNIEITHNTKFFNLLKTKLYQILSIHHQAIDRLGKDLITSAQSEDNIIEVIEHVERNFILGIQGHIEQSIESCPLYIQLIDAFIEHANKKPLMS